jgi:acyl-[acyl-carrier-protein]-phospholipid O-acyltransferase/long-chain-fatty-acid--[acyl-carrier-protein] ligase
MHNLLYIDNFEYIDMHLYEKHSQRSFRFLNATQFLGALNDNVFKLLIVFFLINVQGAANAPAILASVGAVFVIPFLLFSSAAGVLADKISKRGIIVITKVAEVVIMSLSLVIIYLKSSVALFALLFLMATQSSLFGPSKYGIIPEIVDPDKVSKANGVITSLTFLAIIIGTFLASFVTDISNKNFFISFFFCVFIALLGLMTSFGIEKTKAKKSKKKINPFFVYEIYKTLTLCYKRKHLLSSVIGSAFFLFIGGFTQLNTIPFAIQALGLNEIQGGYLFLTTAIGIAGGSFLAGKLSKDQIQLGLSCIAGFGMTFLLFLLTIFSHFLVLEIIIFILLGFCGGLFVVPFDTFVQVKSPDSRRGQIIAASNFLSFCGVLLASLALYLISDLGGFSSSSGFALMGLGTLVFSFIVSCKTSDLFLPYLTEKIFLPLYSVKTTQLPPPSSLLIFKKKSWMEALMLFSVIPNLNVIMYRKQSWLTRSLNFLFSSFYLITNKEDFFEKAVEKANEIKEKDSYVCLFLPKTEKESDIQKRFTSCENKSFSEISFVQSEKHLIKMKFLGISYKKRLLFVSFITKSKDDSNNSFKST